MKTYTKLSNDLIAANAAYDAKTVNMTEMTDFSEEMRDVRSAENALELFFETKEE